MKASGPKASQSEKGAGEGTDKRGHKRVADPHRNEPQ